MRWWLTRDWDDKARNVEIKARPFLVEMSGKQFLVQHMYL
jgi:hypothetical protein